VSPKPSEPHAALSPLLDHEPTALFLRQIEPDHCGGFGRLPIWRLDDSKDSARFLMSDTAQKRFFFATFFAIVRYLTSAPLRASQALRFRPFTPIRPHVRAILPHLVQTALASRSRSTVSSGHPSASTTAL
jgi:hypothetical protein